MVEFAQAGGCCCCLTVIITLSVVLGMGFKTINTNVVAFKYDGNAMALKEDEMETSPGLKFVGPGRYYVEYTTLEQTMSFPKLKGRTADGLEIEVNFEFQYKYEATKDSLLNIYYMFGNRDTKRKNTFKQFAYSGAMDALAEYTAYEANEQKDALANTLKSKIQMKMHSMFGTSITTLQLSGVTLPSAIANAILDTQSIKEQINAASNAKDTAAVNAQTSVYNAELQAAVTLYTAESTATAVMTEATADASAITTEYVAEADAYKVLYDELTDYFNDEQNGHSGTFDTDDFLNYVLLESLEDVSNGEVFFNVDKPDQLAY